MSVFDELERLYPVIPKCPFCGGASSPNSNWKRAWVDCDTCYASGPKFVKPFHNPIEGYIKAIEAWSVRK